MRVLIMGIAIFSAVLIASTPAQAVSLETYLDSQDQVLLTYAVNDSIVDTGSTYMVVQSIDESKHVMTFFQYDEQTHLVTLLDKLNLPPYGRGHIENQKCEVGNKIDGEIIALFTKFRYENSMLVSPAKVWRANRQTKQFEEVSTKNIRCYQQFED